MSNPTSYYAIYATFSVITVRNSSGRAGGTCVAGGGACVAGGRACMVGPCMAGMCVVGGAVWQGGMHGENGTHPTGMHSSYTKLSILAVLALCVSV